MRRVYRAKFYARSLADKRFTAHEHPTRIYIILRDHGAMGRDWIFVGSIPFGVLISGLMGLGDLRKIGSGNIGATNVLRTETNLRRAT